MPDGQSRASPRSPSPKIGSAKLPPLSKFYYGPAQGWTSTEASPIQSGSTWGVNSTHEIPPNLPTRLSPAPPAYSPSHWQNTFPRGEEAAAQGWQQNPLPSAPPPSAFANSYALMPGPSNAPVNPGWDSRPTSASYDPSTWAETQNHRHSHSVESAPKPALPPRPSKPANQSGQTHLGEYAGPTSSYSTYDPRSPSSRVSATTIDVPVFLQSIAYDPETAPPLPQRPSSPPARSYSPVQSPPRPQRLPPPPPKIPLESNDNMQNQRPTQRPRYDPQNSSSGGHTRHDSRGSMRRPQFDPQNSHDDGCDQSLWQRQSQRPSAPTPHVGRHSKEPAFPQERSQDSPQGLPLRQEQPSLKQQDRGDSESRYQPGQHLHQSSISPVVARDNAEWTPTSSQRESPGAYVVSPEHQHAVLPHLDAQSISATEISSNRATLSTPGSQQTSNTSYRESENQSDKRMREETVAVDSFYWNSGRSSSDADEEQSLTGPIEEPDVESSHDQGSSTTTTSTLKREESSVPVRSTNLPPPLAPSYGASALGFGGPSDWEYFGDYEAEVVDDEELYTRPKPRVELPADYSHLETAPIAQEQEYERVAPEQKAQSTPPVPERSPARKSILGEPSLEGTFHAENNTVVQSVSQSQWSPSTASPTTPHASSHRPLVVPENLSPQDPRPDLDDVIRAWSEAPHIGIMSGGISSKNPTPKNDGEHDHVAEASLASTPGERTLGLGMVLKSASSIPRLPDSVDQAECPQKGSDGDEGASFEPSNMTRKEKVEEVQFEPSNQAREVDDFHLATDDTVSSSGTVPHPTTKSRETKGEDIISSTEPENKIQPRKDDESSARSVYGLVTVSPHLKENAEVTQAVPKEHLGAISHNDGSDASRHVQQKKSVSTLSHQQPYSATVQESHNDRIRAAPEEAANKTAQVASQDAAAHDGEEEPILVAHESSLEAVQKPRPLVLSRETSREVLTKPSTASLRSIAIQNQVAKEDSPRMTNIKPSTAKEFDQSPKEDKSARHTPPPVPQETLKSEIVNESSQEGLNKAPKSSVPSNEVVVPRIENAADPYADLDPWGKASLNRFAAMLREEARAETNKDKLNIFNVFTSRESRLRVVLYGSDEELILPRDREVKTSAKDEIAEPSKQTEKGGSVRKTPKRTSTVSLHRSLKALPALPANRESIVGPPTSKLAPLVIQHDAPPAEDDLADSAQYSPGGRPVAARMTLSDNRRSQQALRDSRASLAMDLKKPQDALPDGTDPPSLGSNAPILATAESGLEVQAPAYSPEKYNDGRSEVKNYLTNRRSVYRPFATQTMETMETGSKFDKDPDFKVEIPVSTVTAPRSQYNTTLQPKDSGTTQGQSVTGRQKPPDGEQPSDMRRFIDADFDPLLMVLPESEPVIHESLRFKELKSGLEAAPDDFTFIHGSVVGWDAKIKKQREENERQRHARQAESEQKIDSLFDDHEIGYGDISELESDFKRSEAERKAGEDRFEYETFVADVFDLVWTRLHYELDQLYPHYQRYGELMNGTLAGKDMFEQSKEGLALAPTMSAFLTLHQKVEIRHQKAFEAVLERDRRLKKTEISPWYAQGNIAEVKHLEKQFEDAEKKAIIEYCQQRDTRANELMDVLDQNTLRGVGANQDYMEAIMKAVRRIASGRAFVSVPGPSQPNAGLELVHKAKAITSQLATSSEQIVQTFHVADMLLNSADYEVSVAKAKVAKADKATLTKLKEERTKEDQKLMRDLEHRLALIREDLRRTNDEIVKLMLFLGVESGRAITAHVVPPPQATPADLGHESRIQKALEEAKRRNASKDSGG